MQSIIIYFTLLVVVCSSSFLLPFFYNWLWKMKFPESKDLDSLTLQLEALSTIGSVFIVLMLVKLATDRGNVIATGILTGCALISILLSIYVLHKREPQTDTPPD